MDGTLCNYEAALLNSLNELKGPKEKILKILPHKSKIPAYLKARVDLIRDNTKWWINIPPLPLGMQLWRVAGEIGFRRMILTHGSRRYPKSWMAKKMWIDKYLGSDVDITITRDKGLVYGRVLVDDWPDYIIRWAKWMPRGLIVMPDGKHNQGFEHDQVIRYDGNNFEKVAGVLQDKFDFIN